MLKVDFYREVSINPSEVFTDFDTSILCSCMHVGGLDVITCQTIPGSTSSRESKSVHIQGPLTKSRLINMAVADGVFDPYQHTNILAMSNLQGKDQQHGTCSVDHRLTISESEEGLYHQPC